MEGLTQSRLSHRASDEIPVLPQSHMNSPVVTRRLGELTGAVERIDDPHSPSGVSVVSAHGAAMFLLAQDGVIRAVLGQRCHQELMSGEVASVFECLAFQTLRSHLQQEASGLGGQPGREIVVVAGNLGACHSVTLATASRRTRPDGRRCRGLAASQELNRAWVISRPCAINDSTASAAVSIWKGSSLRSVAE